MQKKMKKLIKIFAYIKKAIYLCPRIQEKSLNDNKYLFTY